MFTYCIPLLTVFLNVDLSLCVLLILLVLLTIFISNSSIPNPILRIAGYHFYTVDIDDGLSGYTLLVKKKYLDNKEQIKEVYAPLEFMLIGKTGHDEDEARK